MNSFFANHFTDASLPLAARETLDPTSCPVEACDWLPRHQAPGTLHYTAQRLTLPRGSLHTSGPLHARFFRPVYKSMKFNDTLHTLAARLYSRGVLIRFSPSGSG